MYGVVHHRYSVNVYGRGILVMGTFEQLNDFIYLDGKIVFTLNALRNHVSMQVDYPTDLEFYPNGIHKDYYGQFDDFCIDKWLDDEVNFQSACKGIFDGQSHVFVSKNTEQETRKDLYPFAKGGVYNVKPATKSK